MSREWASERLAIAEWSGPAIALGVAAGCEAVTVAAGPVAGALGYALLLLITVNLFVVNPQDPALRPYLLVALVALGRLMTLALASAKISPLGVDAAAGALLLVALRLALRVIPIDLSALRLPRSELPSQGLIALCGLPAGVVGQRILQPHPLAHPHQVGRTVIAVIVLCCVVAPALEMLFRWVLQAELFSRYGASGVLLVNLVFAALYLGTRSAGYVALMGAAGVGLAAATRRTGRIWGAIGAHAILDVGVLIVWPAVLS